MARRRCSDSARENLCPVHAAGSCEPFNEISPAEGRGKPLQCSFPSFEHGLQFGFNLALRANHVIQGFSFNQSPRTFEAAVVQIGERRFHVFQQILPHEHGDEAGAVGEEIARISRRPLTPVFRLPVEQRRDYRLSSIQAWSEYRVIERAKNSPGSGTVIDAAGGARSPGPLLRPPRW